MHALGFHHEQSRPDRDRFVKVNFDNIKSGDAAKSLPTAIQVGNALHSRLSGGQNWKTNFHWVIAALQASLEQAMIVRLSSNPVRLRGSSARMNGNPVRLSGSWNSMRLSGNRVRLRGNPVRMRGNSVKFSGNPVRLGGNPVLPVKLVFVQNSVGIKLVKKKWPNTYPITTAGVSAKQLVLGQPEYTQLFSVSFITSWY